MYLVFCEFMAKTNIVDSFHHKMAIKRCLEDYEVERQLKCTICDMGLCIFRCFKKYPIKLRLSYMMRGEVGIHIKQITKKGMYIEFYCI